MIYCDWDNIALAQMFLVGNDPTNEIQRPLIINFNNNFLVVGRIRGSCQFCHLNQRLDCIGIAVLELFNTLLIIELSCGVESFYLSDAHNGKAKGLASCSSQITSPFGCLNNSYFKLLSNFFWGGHLRLPRLLP